MSDLSHWPEPTKTFEVEFQPVANSAKGELGKVYLTSSTIPEGPPVALCVKVCI